MKVLGAFFVLAIATCLAIELSAQSQNSVKNQWIAFNRAGAGNSNLQCFKPNNIQVAGGLLSITTKKESANCSSIDLAPSEYKYTSGFISMRTFHFLYGTVEFRAKFGGGDRSGAWPVIWMNDAPCQPSDPTGTDDPCKGQEIDVAEILDGNFQHVNQQIHTDNFIHNDGCTASVSDTSRNFHTYKMDWNPGILNFSVDGVATCRINGPYVPNVPMYLKITMFVGSYGGPLNESTLPWTTSIDYVRIKKAGEVVFEDDFNSQDTIQPAEYIPMSPPATSLSSRFLAFIRERRRLLIITLPACLAATFVLFRRRASRANSNELNRSA